MGETGARTIYVMASMIVIAAIIGILCSTTGRAECVNTAGVDGLPDNAVTLNCVPESCTIFTASYGDAVLFGNNEDWINPNTYYWVVPSKNGEYGAFYVGFDNFRPQGGINEKGLAFDINALPKAALKRHPELPRVEKPFYAFLKTCTTVEEVIDTVKRYSWEGAWRAQVHVADRTGDAVVISAGPDGEIAYTRKQKGNGYLVSTNFNRANPQNGRYPCRRYDTAVAMLERVRNEDELTVEYARSILDAVHIEGPYGNTVYSNIFDLKNGIIYLYHWHQFGEVVTLDVAEEITGAPAPTRISSLFTHETVDRASRMYQEYRKKITFWKNVAWVWVLLAAGSVVVLLWSLTHGTRVPWGMRLIWLLSVALFGPLGLAAYLYSCRQPLRSPQRRFAAANRRCALGETVFSVTGFAIGTTLAFASFYVILPLNESGLWSTLARIYGLPLIIGLFLFHAPLTAVVAKKGYWASVRGRFPFAVTSLNFALIGLLPVSGILLVVSETTLGLRGPGSVLFWGIMAIGAVAGALVLYPFSLYVTRRGFGGWPHPAYPPENGTIGREGATIPPAYPGTPWCALLLSFVLLSGTIVMVLAYLS